MPRPRRPRHALLETPVPVSDTHDIITDHHGFPGGTANFLRADGAFAAPDGGAAHATSHQNGGSDEITVVGLSGLLADGQTPLAHAASHQNGGSDEVSVAGLSGLLADNQTPATHDILTKHNGFPGGGTTFLRDDGTFAAPPGGGGGDSITVNGVALVDADFDNATPAPPAGEINVKWQKDGGSPANVSASVQAATTTVKGVVELAIDGEAAASVVVQGNDARMSNARTPTSHATSHQNGSVDEISVAGLSGLLADGQTPLSHAASHQNGGIDEISVEGLSGLLADTQQVNIQDEGSSVSTRRILNFTGAGVTAADNPGSGRCDITIAGGGGGSPFMFEGVLASDVSTAANTTPVNVTGLVFTFLANKRYVVEVFGFASSAVATTGYGIQLDVSVAVTRLSMCFFHQLTVAGTLSGGHSIADDASVGLSSGVPGTAIIPFYAAGTVQAAGTGGTAQLRWRSEVAAVSTCRAGTIMRVRELP